MLQDFARACAPESTLAEFEFKGVSPVFVDETFELQAWTDAADKDHLVMRVIDAHGALAMQASARLESRRPGFDEEIPCRLTVLFCLCRAASPSVATKRSGAARMP
ncbi:MAG TPA: hypothetical protein VEI25_18095 [Paraburkholderia sp.]|nr:hypothetical protein [Paraburkholderia sp.]